MNENDLYSKEQIRKAISFVIKDNPDRIWKDDEELAEAIESHLIEDFVVSNLEECKRLGLVEEVSPGRFAPTKLGLALKYKKDLMEKGEDQTNE